jgi:hypothetical protein
MLAVIAITPQRRQRHAFVVEDAHILSFPPPSQGANRKAIPKWDGFEV